MPYLACKLLGHIRKKNSLLPGVPISACLTKNDGHLYSLKKAFTPSGQKNKSGSPSQEMKALMLPSPPNATSFRKAYEFRVM